MNSPLLVGILGAVTLVAVYASAQVDQPNILWLTMLDQALATLPNRSKLPMDFSKPFAINQGRKTIERLYDSKRWKNGVKLNERRRDKKPTP